MSTPKNDAPTKDRAGGETVSETHRPMSQVSTHRQGRLVLASVVLLIAYGLVFGGGYGESIDEPAHARFGRQILRVYLGQHDVEDTAVNPLQHGPFYSFTAYVVGGWVTAVRPGWLAPDGRHFAYYLSFILATIFIGVLVRRYTRPSVAWLAAGLFFTQPLLLGHAFINPKDIPFMAFFLGGLTLGVLALPKPTPADATPGDVSHRGGDAPPSARRRRLILILTGSSFLAALFLAVLWFWDGLIPFLDSILTAAYNGQASWPVQTLFNAIATDAHKTPLVLYHDKLVSAFNTLRIGATITLVLGAIVGWVAASMRHLRRWIHGRESLMLAVGAGIMIGLDTSIRSVAPYALVPLAFLMLRYSATRRRGLLSILLMAAASIAACLATWPFLWQDTISRYVQSVLMLSQFPWQGFILFNGRLLTEGQQPWYFIPALMMLQITLPAIALAAVGAVMLWRRPETKQAKVEVGVLLVTFALPVLASLRPGTIVYNNFRQLLFTVPALFMLAGLGIEQVFRWLKDPRWRYALGLIALVPGIAGIVRLHPFEYMYYNALAGLGGDVYTRFESDYWCTADRQALAWLNDHAKQGAVVEVGGSGVIGQTFEFARSDLRLVRIDQTGSLGPSDYVLICDGKNGMLDILPGARTLVRIEKAGATLAEIKIRNSP